MKIQIPFLDRWVPKKEFVLGLDIGSFSIKAVKLRRVGADARPVWAGYRQVDASADAGQQAEQLRQLLDGQNPEQCLLVTAVGGSDTVLRTTVMPRMTGKELASSILYETDKLIPFKVEDVYLATTVLRDRPGGKMEVLLAAARKDFVNQHLALLNAAGLKPAIVDLESLALTHAWEKAVPKIEKPQVSCFVYIGASRTELLFFDGGRLQFTRELPIGGNDFTKAVAQVLQLDLAQAEDLKCMPGNRKAELQNALQRCGDKWVSACRASFDFYENQFAKGVQALVLGGGAANLPELKQWCESGLGIAPQAWNPMRELHIEPALEQFQVCPLGWSVALGLAYRGTAA